MSLGEQLDTRTPAGVLTLTLLGAVAQMEREQIGERTRAAMAYKRGLGERVGTVPLGFQPAGDGPMAPVPAELDVVRYILRQRGAGAAFRAIARQLASEGLSTKQGGRWHASTVRAVWEGGPGSLHRGPGAACRAEKPRQIPVMLHASVALRG